MKRKLSVLLSVIMLASAIPVHAIEVDSENLSNYKTFNTEDSTNIIESNENDVVAEDEATESESEVANESIESLFSNQVNTLTSEEWLGLHADNDEYESEYALDDNNIRIETNSSSVSGWVSCGTMTSARSYMSSAVVNNKIYTFGGQQNGQAVKTCEMFDTSNEIWYRRTSMPNKRYKHNALAIGDKIYICGGYDENNNAISYIDVYNTTSDIWEDSINTPNENTNYASVVYKDKLYLISGIENGVNSGKIYVYNFENSQWENKAEIDEKYIDAKSGVQDNSIVLFTGNKMVFYNADKSFTKESTRALERDLVDYAVISRNYKNTPLYSANIKSFDGFYLTGGHPKDSDISTAATTAYYTGIDFYDDSAGWTYDLRLIRGLSCHNMIEANDYIYVFGGQVVKGTDQKLMFKRSIYDLVDDVPGVAELKNGAVVGSINSYGDTDSFTFTPKETSIYSFRPYTYWYGLEFKLFKGSSQIGDFYDQGGIDKYVYGFERLLYAGKTYRIDINVPVSYDQQWGTYAFAYVPISDDAPNYLEEANSIKLENNYKRKFEAIDDIDCFKFNIIEEGKYNLNIETENSTKLKYYVYKESNTGTVLYEGTGTTTEVMRLKPGSYYLKFQGQSGEYSFDIKHKANIHKLLKNRSKHQLNSVNGKLYAIAGLDNHFHSMTDIEVYDTNDYSWAEAIKNLNVNDGFTSVPVGNCIYIIGGRNTKTGKCSTKIQRYVVDTEDFFSVGKLNIERERAGLAVKDDNIYIVGGRNESGYLDSIEIFNTETNTVTGSLNLPKKMIDPQAFFYNDTLYVIAGTDENGFSGDVYALENNEWVQKKSMSYISEYVRGEAYKGKFYCAAVNEKENIDILQYDVQKDEWNIIENNFAKDLIYYDVSILNGLIYIVGGYSPTADETIREMYSFDFITNISDMDKSIPIRTMGNEYEQSVNDSCIEPPLILGVNANVIDRNKGIYKLYMTDENYKYDGRNAPFFFWSAREGTFRALSDDYSSVMFYADPGTGNRQVKVIVGIGDGRGYVDKKAFLLEGNSEAK